jgi:hypothetical protein
LQLFPDLGRRKHRHINSLSREFWERSQSPELPEPPLVWRRNTDRRGGEETQTVKLTPQTYVVLAGSPRP